MTTPLKRRKPLKVSAFAKERKKEFLRMQFKSMHTDGVNKYFNVSFKCRTCKGDAVLTRGDFYDDYDDAEGLVLVCPNMKCPNIGDVY